ncbi:MAG: sugar ABC transporter permease [Cohnella sp.]|nr:sugar ABC transporter permease [Cohnella sp.]
MRHSWGRYVRQHYPLYLFLLPGLVYLLLFKYAPLYGLLIAFKDFSLFSGNTIVTSIWNSPWVGWKHFEQLLNLPAFTDVLLNTVIISLYKIVFLFPLPILFALLLNEIMVSWFKRFIQTVLYLPHFLSWVVVGGIFYSILGTNGLVTQLFHDLFGSSPSFLMDAGLFRRVLVFQEGWKETGWNMIIYLAAISAVDPHLYEAAKVDGAGRFQRMLYVTLPGIGSTIVLMLIMRLSRILEAGFEQILVMYNPTVYSVSDIIQTYTYRVGLGQMNFSLATAVGIFNSVTAFALIVTANAACRKLFSRSIY